MGKFCWEVFLVVVLFSPLCFVYSTPTFSYPGDVYIGVLIDLHLNNCTDLNPAAVQQLWAAIWATETLNNQTEIEIPKLGLKIYDMCNNPTVTVQHTISILQSTLHDFPTSCRQSGSVPMLGVIGVGEANALRPALGFLQAYSVPLILATSSAASELPPQSNMMTTAPTMASLVQAAVSLVMELQFKRIHVLSSSPMAMQDMTSLAAQRDLTVSQTLTLSKHAIRFQVISNIIGNKKAKRRNPRLVILLLEAKEVDWLVDIIREEGLEFREVIWLVASPSFDASQMSIWSSALGHGFFITPHPIHLKDFRYSFLNALAGRTKNKPLQAIDAYLQKEYHCDISNRTSSTPCSKLTTDDLQKGFRQNPNVPFVSRAVSALAAAFRMVQIEQCRLAVQCVKQGLSMTPMFQEIADALAKLSFAIQDYEPVEVEGTRLKFTEDGKIIFKHLDLQAFNGSFPLNQVGWYSSDMGLKINAAWRQSTSGMQFYQNISKLQAMESYAEEQGHGILEQEQKQEQEQHHIVSGGYSRSWMSVQSFFGSGSWATAVVAFACSGLILAVYIFSFVLHKICHGILTGNQFLGILLLLGIFGLYATCILFVTAPPSEAFCNWRLFLHSFSNTLCYGVLFVKVMQLKSLLLLGLGGRLSHANQAFTLFFIVAVQVALNIQWSVLKRPLFGTGPDGSGPQCVTSKMDFAWLQAYIVIILLMTVCYAVHLRHVRRNHNEGRWVLLVTLIHIPLWGAWMVVYLIVTHTEHAEASICIHLLLSATSIIAFIFIPKMRMLSQRSHQRASSSSKQKDITQSMSTIFSLSHDAIDFTAHNGLGKVQTATITAGGGGEGGMPQKSFCSSLFPEGFLRNPHYSIQDKANEKNQGIVAGTQCPS